MRVLDYTCAAVLGGVAAIKLMPASRDAWLLAAMVAEGVTAMLFVRGHRVVAARAMYVLGALFCARILWQGPGGAGCGCLGGVIVSYMGQAAVAAVILGLASIQICLDEKGSGGV